MRIAFDLDETLILNSGKSEPLKYRFLEYISFTERLRIGTVHLFRYLEERKYRISVYTSSDRSVLYIKLIFFMYGLKLDSVINYTIHQRYVRVNSSKYPPEFGIDVLVDDSEGVAMEGRKFGFPVIQIHPEDENWVQTVKNQLPS